jgi:AraC-like DNA-binding protein
VIAHADLVRREPDLSRFVRAVRVLVPRPGETRLHIDALPDGSESLLFRLTAGSIDGASAGPGRDGTLSIAGARSRALFKSTAAVPLAIGIQLQPGTAHLLFGIPASDITDRFALLEDAWGAEGRRLHDRLLSTRGVEAMIATLLGAIRERGRKVEETPSALLVRRALRFLETRAVPERVEQLAGALSVTPRHLRRAFTDNVGLGPKRLLRIARLQRALRAAERRASWTEIASGAGYYDQAHLIAEFRELAGVTPRAFAERAAAVRW